MAKTVHSLLDRAKEQLLAELRLDIRDPRVLAAIASVPASAFCPKNCAPTLTRTGLSLLVTARPSLSP